MTKKIQNDWMFISYPASCKKITISMTDTPFVRIRFHQSQEYLNYENRSSLRSPNCQAMALQASWGMMGRPSHVKHLKKRNIQRQRGSGKCHREESLPPSCGVGMRDKLGACFRHVGHALLSWQCLINQGRWRQTERYQI